MATAFPDVGSAAARGITRGTNIGLALRAQAGAEKQQQFDNLQTELTQKRADRAYKTNQLEKALEVSMKIKDAEGMASALKELDVLNGTDMSERIPVDKLPEFRSGMVEIDKIEDPRTKAMLTERFLAKYPRLSALSDTEERLGLERTRREAAFGEGPEAMEQEAFVEKLTLPKAPKAAAPTNLAKLMTERAELLGAGIPEDDERIQAYNSKISGTDIDIKDLTQEEVDVFGSLLNLNGRMPSLGRGKQAAKARIAIAKSAARQALAQDPDAPPEIPEKTPSEAAIEILGTQTDTKAIQGSLNFLEKQIGAMGSFVTNMESQVAKVTELSKDLKTFDTRLLNIPLRVLRGRIVGSALQAKYDLYLTEIEGEIGKLATGSSASIAELSATAQEKWAKIHDKNLSVKDMLSLLEETVDAGKMRANSVQVQLDKTRGRMRRRGVLAEKAEPTVTERRTIDGRTLVKMSDGTLREE